MLKKSKKKSTTKYAAKRMKRVPLLIPVIALLEVIVLIGVSTYAWYYFNADKQLGTGVITVAADSGLDIDFKDANDETYIDIWNYIQDDFTFSPATSIDGRNIYFPTSGTFNNTNTSNMTFREGTINDINTKYVNIDFQLTNTNAAGSGAMEVYLSNRSKFTISHTKNDNTPANSDNGSALRLAFYNNDGNSGNVGSTMLSKMSTTTKTTESSAADTDNYYTVYFVTPRDNFTPKAYVWDSTESTNNWYKSWPGVEMKKVAGNLYSYTFPKKEVYSESQTNNFNKIIFHNGYGTIGVDKTNTYNISQGKQYVIDSATDNSGSALTMRTVYFLKPTDWYVSDTEGTPKAIVSTSVNSSGEATGNILVSGGEYMTQVTTGIYAYTYPTVVGSNSYDYISFSGILHSGDSYGTRFGKGYHISADTDGGNNRVCYFSTTAGDGALATVAYDDANIYFYNSRGWTQPYAYVNAFPYDVPTYTYAIPMVALSGNVYYCTMPSVFLSDKMTINSSNCKVFFADKHDCVTNGAWNDSSTAEKTVSATCISDYIYRVLSTKTDSKYNLDPERYDMGTVGSGETRYAVISPGVSAGFQRSANPVNEIDNATGAVESIVPTFASSFDDYIYGNNNPVFTIQPQETVSMSMIIWLEGTDVHCTNENYAAKYINLYLEFITVNSFGGADTSEALEAEAMHTYHFIDATEQIWTSDTVTNQLTGVTVKPVMQMYDKTIKRGYLMHQKSTASYGGRNHVDVWECTAPVSVANENHEIEFRRVNPYDEDEIWNRWDAGAYKTYYPGAVTGTISFTAFADGSPDASMYGPGTTKNFSDLPAKSCGGLWGVHETEQLVLYDGRGTNNMIGDVNFASSGENIDTLTIRYTYNYGQGGADHTIEYRVAGGWRDMAASAANDYQYITRSHFYSFVIPTDIYTKATKCQFVQYSGFNDKYAINSDRNTALTLQHIWRAGTVDGNFFEFNEKNSASPDNSAHTANSSSYHSYWGSDVIYVQAKSGIDRAFTKDGSLRAARMRFKSGSNYAYSYLYKNDAYKNADGDFGSYVAVVPTDRSYSSYRLETMNGATSTTVSFSSVEKGIDSHTTIKSGVYRNTTYATETVDGRTVGYNKNTMTVDPGCMVFLGLSKSCNNNNARYTNDTFYSPIIHWWYDSSDRDGVVSGDIQMTFSYQQSGTGEDVYSVAGVPKGAKYKFHWNRNSDDYYYKTGDYENVTHGMERWLKNDNNDWNNLTLYLSSNTHTDNNPDDSFLFLRRWSSLDFTQNGDSISVPAYEPRSTL